MKNRDFKYLLDTKSTIPTRLTDILASLVFAAGILCLAALYVITP